jgi:hypothetical protein
VEALQDLLGGLLRTREQLRVADAGWLVLERNRREIARLQRELSYALIERHAVC